MRVVLVTNQYAPVIGGIENLLRQLAPHLRARGHDVAVLTGTHRDAQERRAEVDGIPVFRSDLVRAVARRDPFAIAQERKAAQAVIGELAPDVIHAHDCGPLLWAIADSGPPVLATLHVGTALFETAQFAPIARQLSRCDWLTAVSRTVADEAVELVPTLAGRISVVTNGVAVPPEPPAADPAAHRVVAAGRMAPQKGFDVLLRAFAALAATDDRAELVIVGGGSQRAELEALAAELGVADRVEMPGPARHADMPGVFASASVVAIPSRFEGMPLVALEAGLAARPVVATPVQGLGEVVVDGETGLLVPPEDPAALAAALTELLDDPDRAARMGRAARRHVIANCSLDAMTGEYETLYARLAGGRVVADAVTP